VQLKGESLEALDGIVAKIKGYDDARNGNEAQYTFDISRDVEFINELFNITRHIKAAEGSGAVDQA
jgi:hypothetical protein